MYDAQGGSPASVSRTQNHRVNVTVCVENVPPGHAVHSILFCGVSYKSHLPGFAFQEKRP
jgi:hypothetical protein